MLIDNNTYVTQAGTLFHSVLKELENSVDVICISFDVEAISSVYCPGVSIPAVNGGLTDEEGIEIGRLAG